MVQDVERLEASGFILAVKSKKRYATPITDRTLDPLTTKQLHLLIRFTLPCCAFYARHGIFLAYGAYHGLSTVQRLTLSCVLRTTRSCKDLRRQTRQRRDLRCPANPSILNRCLIPKVSSSMFSNFGYRCLSSNRAFI